MKYRLTILTLIITNLSYANFGGYYRYSSEGGGTILNSSSNQEIELVKEVIDINLDQRVNFQAVFHLQNTSASIQTITLAFPQYSYWDIPYLSGEGYSPGKYYPLNEKLKIDGSLISFDEELYSTDLKDVKNVALKNQSEFQETLVSYAGRHEAESPPSMSFVIWKLKTISFAPNETKSVDISFTRPWFYEDEVWSNGIRTDGERTFEYVFETANTWKNSRIKEFDLTIKFPQESWDNLNLNSEWFTRSSENTVSVKKENWSPKKEENLKIRWNSDYIVKYDDYDCHEAVYYDDYSWRYGFDGSSMTSWCITPSTLNCGQFEIVPNDFQITRSESDRIQPTHQRSSQTATKIKLINGFAKSEKLASENAKPKTLILSYRGRNSQNHVRKIKLENHIEIQTFDLKEEALLSENFKIQFVDFYEGRKYQDICLAEIWLE